MLHPDEDLSGSRAYLGITGHKPGEFILDELSVHCRARNESFPWLISVLNYWKGPLLKETKQTGGRNLYTSASPAPCTHTLVYSASSTIQTYGQFRHRDRHIDRLNHNLYMFNFVHWGKTPALYHNTSTAGNTDQELINTEIHIYFLSLSLSLIYILYYII